MKLPHDREHLVHLRRGPRILAPVPSGEGDLAHLLAGAEAVIGRAAGKALVPEVVVDAAPEVCLQVGAGMPGGLVYGEISRSRECRCHAAQPETACAISAQDPLP